MSFKPSLTDKRRVLIIDVSHLFYKYAYGGASNLSATINIDGVPTRVNTTLPTYTIKQIHRWSLGGINPTVVCFDGAGATKSRHAYFIHHKLRDMSTYKEGRARQSSDFYEGINATMNLLSQGGVCVLKKENFEADDLIKVAVDKAKEDFPDLYIDVITGDGDLVPLVDEQVSVFLSSKKITWATEKSLEKRGYVQLTPENFSSYIENLTEYKGLVVPYNTVLLKKMLRGDKSDKIPAYPKFTPTKYNNLVNSLIEDGYDATDMFRYDAPTQTICYRGTEEPIPESEIDSIPNERKMIKFGEPPKLTCIREALSKYLDSEIVEHAVTVYNGINLNCAFTGLGDDLNRRPVRLSAEIKGYNAADLQCSVSQVMINLPTF